MEPPYIFYLCFRLFFERFLFKYQKNILGLIKEILILLLQKNFIKNGAACGNRTPRFLVTFSDVIYIQFNRHCYGIVELNFLEYLLKYIRRAFLAGIFFYFHGYDIASFHINYDT